MLINWKTTPQGTEVGFLPGDNVSTFEIRVNSAGDYLLFHYGAKEPELCGTHKEAVKTAEGYAEELCPKELKSQNPPVKSETDAVGSLDQETTDAAVLPEKPKPTTRRSRGKAKR